MRVKRFRHEIANLPETTPRATLAWTYSGPQMLNTTSVENIYQYNHALLDLFNFEQ